jgi:hypothetical protein
MNFPRDFIVMAAERDELRQRVVHFGPIWGNGPYGFAACDSPGPNMLTTHEPWVNCPQCRHRMSANTSTGQHTER